MAVRRSARLRRTPSEEHQPQAQPQSEPINRLDGIMERDETPVVEAPTAQTPLKTPSDKTKTPNLASGNKSAGSKTPTSIPAFRPSHEEMHPSKVHQSTAKKADTGMILGFNPVQRDAEGNIVKDTITQNTPTKAKTLSKEYGTPGFEFKFSCQESELSDEAKKLMESVREDVARIKSQMVLEKDDQTQENEAELHRKIAKPRGQAGRFSDAHMTQFKKMDSIAGHASAFRATPGRFQPVQKTLKRTNSKARLDEEGQSSLSKPTPKRSPAPVAPGAKRVKHDKNDDASTRRPASKEESVSKPTPRSGITRPRSTVRSSLFTPTKASAARSSASVHPPRTSMIPSLVRSPAAKDVASPRTPRTEFNPKLKSGLPTLGNLKSILRRRQPLFSKDPAKIAAGTHSAAPDFTSDLLFGGAKDNAAPEEPVQTPSPKKRVVFTPCTKSPFELAQASPSPTKIPTAQASSSDVVYPTLPTLTPEKDSAQPANVNNKPKTPTIRQVRPSDVAPKATPVPEIPGVLHGIGNKKRQRSETDDEADTENVPPADPKDERSAKRVKMNTPIQHKLPTPSPVKVRTTKTPLRTTGSRGTGTPASAKRGSLSVSRLNMLAKPKSRA